ncbi:MAG: alpha/beta hydrolase [Treponema sp.]|nr:alpha/beta hydrolase [Treponema sp.]
MKIKCDETISIWGGVPGMEKEETFVYVFQPDLKNKSDAAVIICPGGSYHHLDMINEGYMSGKWFSENGITAFMLCYRTAEFGYHHPAMLQDFQRTIQLVRENADDYGIDVNKVGAIGYSAGGHLVAMAGAFGGKTDELAKIGINSKVSLRPNFVVPVYPVVSMQDDIGHRWSIKSLLGKNPSQEVKDAFSLEMQIPNDMPPTYIVVAKDDNVVKYENSLRLNEAIEAKKIKNCKFTLYDWGKHGFGMKKGRFMKAFHWNTPLKEWLQSIKMI